MSYTAGFDKFGIDPAFANAVLTTQYMGHSAPPNHPKNGRL